jgi:hypothetical protein
VLRVSTASAAVTLAAVAFGRAFFDEHEGALVVAVWAVTYLLLGSFLLVKTASPAIATIVLLIGTAPAVSLDDGSEWSHRLGAALFVTFIASWGLLVHVFPTGRPMAGWWRWPSIGLLVGATLLVAGQLLGVSSNQSNVLVRGLIALVAAVFGIGFVLALPAIMVRFLRSTGQQRAQLKWFVYAVVASVLFWFLPIVDQLSPLLPALAIGIAITRYRLFDIDRLISRTVSYAIVTGVVVMVYAVLVTAISQLVQGADNLAVAAATLTAAAVVRPVLRQVRTRVDRRFNRTRFDAEHAVHQFGTTLRTVVDPDHVIDELTGVVASTVQPNGVGIWLRSAS